MRMPSTHTVEVLSLGRTYINLEGQQIGSSLKDSSTFRKALSGTCALVSMGLSRLGHHCALLSKVGMDPLGEYIKEVLGFENIDSTLLITDPQQETLVALNNTLLSQHHATLSLQENDVDPSMIGHARALFLTSELFCDELSNRAARKAIIAAKDNQTKVILALERGPTLGLETILPFCNLIFGYEEEFQALANTHHTFEALTYLRSLTHATLVIQCAKESYVFEDIITNHWQTSHHAQLNTVQFASFNAHAAFIAGFIDIWLKGEPPANALKQALLCQALVQTAPAHLGLPGIHMLRHYASKNTEPFNTIVESAYFKHLHYVASRHINVKSACLLSLGYHAQWQKLAEPFNASEEMIQRAKALLTQSVLSLGNQHTSVGIISDENPGEEFIQSPIPVGGMIARSVELPNEIPLRFASCHDISHTLLKWPSSHVAKVSITYHPDDRYVTRGEQETVLLSLYHACRETGHPLLIDITPPTNSLITASTLAHIMQRFYDLGIYPDWWQCAAPRDQRSWDSIQRVIEDNDPHCLGVFIQSPITSLDQLNHVLENATKQSICKGIVMGRNFVHSILEQWLSQKMADHIFIEQTKPLFQKMVDSWQSKQLSLVKEDCVS